MGQNTEQEGLAAVAVAGAIADSLESKKTTGALKCRSCGHLIEEQFCSNCGQNKDDLRRSLWRLIGESLGGIFSFESRMLRTWGSLIFKPGKVPHEYAQGARTRYSPPIRVYIVVSFLFFLLLAISGRNLVAFVVEKAPEPTEAEQTQTTEDEPLDINGYRIEMLVLRSQDEFKARNNPNNVAGFIQSLNSDMNEGAVTVNGEPADIRADGIAGEILQNPKMFNQAFTKWLPRIMFVMVPMAMLLGAIFIRGKDALLYDHLVHAIYIHAVLFFMLTLTLFLAPLINGAVLAWGFFLFFLIYLPLSTKAMFKRGWFKTMLTSVGVTALYALIMLIAVTSISVYSISQIVA